MGKIYVVKMECEDTPDIMIVGIATTKEKANEMVSRLESDDDNWEYSIGEYLTDCLIVNGTKELF